MIRTTERERIILLIASGDHDTQPHIPNGAVIAVDPREICHCVPFGKCHIHQTWCGMPFRDFYRKP